MKKNLSVLTILVLVVALFSNVARAQDKTHLLWGMWGSPEEVAVHQKVADAYMAANPDVEIEIWSQPWGDYFTKLDEGGASNQSKSRMGLTWPKGR